jgi:two-component sensor histidine kinase
MSGIFLLLCFPDAIAFRSHATVAADTVIVDRYLKQADSIYYGKDSDSLKAVRVLQLAAKIDSLSNRLSFARGLGGAYMYKGKAYNLVQQRDSARLYAEKAIDVFRKNHLFVLLARAYYQLGDAYATDGDEMKERIRYYEEAAKYFELSGLRVESAGTLQMVADFCMMTDDLLKSRRLLKQAISIYEAENIIDIKGAYDLLNQVETVLGYYPQAYAYGKKAVEIAGVVQDSTSALMCTIYNRLGVVLYYLKKYDSAIICYRKSLDIAVYNKDPQSIWQLTYNLAHAYNRTARYDSALSLLSRHRQHRYPADESMNIMLDKYVLSALISKNELTKAKKVAEDLYKRVTAYGAANPGAEQFAYIDIFRYYLTTGNMEKAGTIMRQAEEIYRRLSMRDPFLQIHLVETALYKKMGNYPAAIRSAIRSKEVSDSIFPIYWQRQQQKLEKQFGAELALKEQLRVQRTALLETNISLQEVALQQARTNAYIIASCALLLLVFAAVTYRIYHLRKKNNFLLEWQKESTARQNISLQQLVDKQMALIAEKEWLIKEVHHRVKNNLQIVVSLLNFQSKYLKDESARTAIHNSQNRVRAMSFIHQQLYGADTLRYVNIEKYIHRLVAYLKDALEPASNISFQLEIVDADMDVADVVPIGLILNEAVTNAVKHAFPGNSGGEVVILLYMEPDGMYVFSIADNGTGVPGDLDELSRNSLGFSLIRTMSEQLHASFVLRQEDGLELKFRFRPRTLYVQGNAAREEEMLISQS